jgi:trimeric autotransporter adhesin
LVYLYKIVSSLKFSMKNFTIKILLGITVFLISTDIFSQTITGSFPQMDGGFENQTAGTIATLSSIATGTQLTNWTVSAGSGTALITGTGGRSGPKFLTAGSSSATARRFQSPTAANSAVGNATAYTIQFFYRTAAATAATNGQANASPDGTANPGTYQALALNGTSGIWTKMLKSVTTGTSANTTKYGISLYRYSAASTVDVDIDDWVMYAGAADVAAPNSPGTATITNPTLTSLDVSWIAATGGTDGGGYVVVRYTVNPNADNDPNQNGIYAVGNTISNGTGGLTGTIRYIGTGTSFTDNSGLTAGQTYYYKIYTVDKAFNYSDEALQNGSTSTPLTPSLTLTSSLTGFGNVCINTVSSSNFFTIDGNNLDGTDITIAAQSGFKYSESATGPFTGTLTFSYSGTAISNKKIYVVFNPAAVQPYNGNINLSGGGGANLDVSATGTGISQPFLITGAATFITASSASLNGTITNIGCSALTGYGFEYSTSDGFIPGSGTVVTANNLSGGNFSATISGLIPNTRYYFRAFGSNSGGFGYGSQLAFTNTPLPVQMAAQPGLSFTETFSDIANWSDFFINGIGANHWDGLSATGSGSIPSANTLTTSTSRFQNPNMGPPVTPSVSGGVHRGTDQNPSTQTLVLLSTGPTENTTSAAIDFYMDFTGVNAGTLSFDYAVVNNSTGNRNGSLRVYATVDGVTFTELTFAGVLNFINNTPLSGSKNNIVLPTIFNNSATARLRFYYYNGDAAVGSFNRPKISIDNLNVTAVASTPCATPSGAATALTFGTITDNSINGSFTAANPATDSYLIIISTNSSLISNPVNNQIYNIGDNVGDGTVIAKTTGTTFTATGLNASSTYYFFVFPVNAICTNGPLYYTTNILTGSAATIASLPNCVSPASQPTSLVFGNTTTNTISGSFTATTADQYLVVRSLSSTLTAMPANGVNYTAGDIIGNSTVVQKSAALSFSAGSLAPNTPYYFFIFSLNYSGCLNGPVYNINSPLNDVHSTIPLPNCITPSAQPTALFFTTSNTQIAGNFTGSAGADDYLVIKSTSPTLSALPVDGVDYNAGDIFGGGTVIKNTPDKSFMAIGLTPGTTYYFYIFAANKYCSNGTKYALQAALAGNATTAVSPANNYYFGSLHSHSDYSDGNADHPGFTPADDYDYAMNSQCMNFLGISEHNHFSSVDNPGNQIANYHLGPVQANNFTASHPGFLALYGMEWGVISGGGHVIVYGDGMDDLWGWETGSGTWGPTSNYDTYVPKSVYTGSTGLFKTVNDNVAKNTFATLAHPNPTDFNNILNVPYDGIADNAIVGTAVETGPAFSTNTTYSNPGASLNYLSYYQSMLSKGYHLGPTIDHDNHNTTFGRATYSRTAVVAPQLTKTSVISGLRNMHFYATQDCDTHVDFTVNTKIMGSVISDRNVPNISVSLSDVSTSLSGAVIRLMYGVPGSGNLPVKIDSAIGAVLNFTDTTLASGATAYYYLDITNGTGRIVTAPVWYTRVDGAVLPVRLSAFSVQKAGKSALLNWTTQQETNSSHFIIERSADGRKWNDIARVNAAGQSSVGKDYRSYDNTPLNGINYYRLKQFDSDGRFEISVVKSVVFNIEYNILIAPNPAKDFINVFAAKSNTGFINIQLSDVSGKVLKNISSNETHTRISVGGIAKGIYFIKVTDEKTVTTQRVVIE